MGTKADGYVAIGVVVDEWGPAPSKAATWEKVFTGEKDSFNAYNMAEMWLDGRGYSVGRMCSPEPTGVMLGDHTIAKWNNLDPTEKAALDGTIEGDFRNGPVTVRLKSKPAGEV